MSARERILARIRECQGRSGEPGEAEIAAVRAHLAAHARNAMPHDTRDAVSRFRERALSLASTVAEAATAILPLLIPHIETGLNTYILTGQSGAAGGQN